MKESPLYEEIMREGREEAHRADIVNLLASRFGKKATAPIADMLEVVHGTDELTGLFQKAIRCRSIAGYRKFVARTLKSPPVS
jgi:hypothetical protein